MKFSASFLLSRRAAQTAVQRSYNLMLGTRSGDQHTFSRSAYAHALAWQRGVAMGSPLNQLARSYVLWRSAIAVAEARQWRAATRIRRAFRSLHEPVTHFRHEYAPIRGRGMVRAIVGYEHQIGGDGRSALRRVSRELLD